METPQTRERDARALLEMKGAPVLCERMQEHGVSIAALAREAQEYRQNVNALLRGSQTYLGPKRRARLVGAIIRLGLDQAAVQKSSDAPEPSDAKAEEKPRPVPRVRRV